MVIVEDNIFNFKTSMKDVVTKVTFSFVFTRKLILNLKIYPNLTQLLLDQLYELFQRYSISEYNQTLIDLWIHRNIA
jgi:hypothetical protein